MLEYPHNLFFQEDIMTEIPLEVGMPAPDFTLQTNTGETISLSDFRGKNMVVLYFYPKADTPGCTTEACAFRDSSKTFDDIHVKVLGISPDTVKKQAKFADKYALPFPLLADENHEIAERYGIWKEKSFMGKKYMGVERTTYIIDQNGIIKKIYPKVSVTGHIEEVLEAVKQFV
jgi:peroxiredoxin Q/BCP